MDYTQSNSYVIDAATGNRMHLEAQAVPTAVSDLDINSLLWSAMEIVKAAGLVGVQFDKTVPATYQKLLTALRSAGVFQTADLGDKSTKAATTEFVQRASGNLSGVSGPVASMNLPLSLLGSIIVFNGSTAGQTLTLPPLATTKNGNGFWIQNQSSVPVTIKANAAESITLNSAGAGASSGNTAVLNTGDSAFIVSGGSGWYEQPSVRSESIAKTGIQGGTLLSPSRALDTTYTNSSVRPKVAYVTFLGGTGMGNLVLTINGVQVGVSGTGISTYSYMTFIVPAGATYSVTSSAATLSTWLEY